MKKFALVLMLGMAAPAALYAAGQEKKAPPAAVSFDDSKTAFQEGNQALKENRWAEAAADYAAAEKLASSDQAKSRAANAQGYAYLKARKYKEAKEAFGRAVGYDPSNKVALSNAGCASSKLYEYGLGGVEELKEAVKQFEACNALDASYKPDFLEKAKADLAKEESYAQAKPAADPDLKSMDYKSLIALGDKEQSEGRFDAALKAFKQAEAVGVSDKSKGAAANRQGRALLDARRNQEATPHFERAVQYQPEEKVYLNNLGQSHWVTYDSGKGTVEDLKKAVENFQKANEIDASFHKENLTMALEELQQVDAEAAKAYASNKEAGADDESASEDGASDKKN